MRALLLVLALPVGALAAFTAAVAGAGVALGDAEHAGEYFVGVGFVAFLVTLPGLQALRWFWRRDGLDPDGAPISREAETDLLRLVAEACEAVGAAAPPRVRISLDHGIGIAGRRSDTLVIGASLADGLPGEALRVAVAHAALRARRLDRWLDRWGRGVVEGVAVWARIPVVGLPWGWLTSRIRPVVANAQRRRVLLADARGARTFGVDAAATYLRARARDGAFAAYWTEDVVPVLDAGFRPPVLDGWRRFRSREWVTDTIATNSADELHRMPAPDDPLPSLGMRLAAIEAPTGAVAGHVDAERFAFDGAPTNLEGAALREHQSEGRVLVELPWERVGEVVWLPRLRAATEAHASALAGITANDLQWLATTQEAPVPADVLGAALAVALVEEGWQLDASPGVPLCARTDDHRLLVIDVLDFLGETDDPEWERFLADAGVEQLCLAHRPAPASPADAPRWDTITVPATLSLPRTRRMRRTTVLLLTAAIPTWTLGSGGYALLIIDGTFNDVITLLLWPLLMAMQVYVVYTRTRLAFRPGSLSITNDELRIEDRGLLGRPLVLGRPQIRTVVIDDGNSRSIAGPPLRFPHGPSQWLHPSRAELAATGWLWSGAHKGSIPMLGAGGETPNVLLIFEDPIIAPRLRRDAAGLPREGDELHALALCVDDPVAAEKAFAGWDLTQSLL